MKLNRRQFIQTGLALVGASAIPALPEVAVVPADTMPVANCGTVSTPATEVSEKPLTESLRTFWVRIADIDYEVLGEVDLTHSLFMPAPAYTIPKEWYTRYYMEVRFSSRDLSLLNLCRAYSQIDIGYKSGNVWESLCQLRDVSVLHSLAKTIGTDTSVSVLLVGNNLVNTDLNISAEL